MVAKYEEGEYAIVEAYKSIRTTIGVNKSLKVILVTSSEMNEGKTTTASNIAQCFADLKDKSVLLIDCDLRKPSIHKQFEVKNDLGLIDILTQERDLAECIVERDDLHILTTGKKPSNPSEILDSDKMKVFLAKTKKQYDYIFIDSPPINRVNDACIIASYADGTLIVSASNEIDINLAKLTKERLAKVNANIIGVVLNKFKASKNDNHGYYGYYDEDIKPSKSWFRKKRR